jgi:kynurenine formamidase
VAKITDLSSTVKNFSLRSDEVKITHSLHEEGRRNRAKTLRLRRDQILRGGAHDHVEALSRAGTHVDAPWHFGPVTAGRPAKKIDEVPLEWCYGDGVLLDFSQT